MKRAIGYIRISDKDQSNFSLSGQEQYIRDFAEKQGYQIISIFKDDGKSAKNFDRPDWQLLQKFCRDNRHEVDALIVAKYDRFSRNLRDALNMIEVLEEKYNIRILSALEPIHMDPASPYYFQFRTQMLLGAQLEWLIIKDRTKAGINVAQRAGRYISTAPYGYINKRDAIGKPIIVIDEAKAPVIRRAFQMALQSASLKEISLEVKRMGWKSKGHSAIKYSLQCCTYAGLTKVSAYGGQPEYFTKGLHEPIINEADWHRVQRILNAPKVTRTVMNEDVPLRSVLKCIHGNFLTAGNSKGRRRYYWYYRNPCCSKNNLPATKLHDQLHQVLNGLSLPDHYLLYLQEKIDRQIVLESAESATMIDDKKRELAGLQQRLDNVEEKFINNEIDGDAYKKWRIRYQQEIAITTKYISDASQPVEKIQAFFRDAIPKLGSLAWHYDLADLHTKQAILRSVFNSQLYYHDGVYRTPYILPAFALKAATLKEQGLLIVEQPLQNVSENGECAPLGCSVEHLTPLLELLNQIKIA